jgi:hypothetical protein
MMGNVGCICFRALSRSSSSIHALTTTPHYSLFTIHFDAALRPCCGVERHPLHFIHPVHTIHYPHDFTAFLAHFDCFSIAFRSFLGVLFESGLSRPSTSAVPPVNQGSRVSCPVCITGQNLVKNFKVARDDCGLVRH